MMLSGPRGAAVKEMHAVAVATNERSGDRHLEKGHVSFHFGVSEGTANVESNGTRNMNGQITYRLKRSRWVSNNNHGAMQRDLDDEHSRLLYA